MPTSTGAHTVKSSIDDVIELLMKDIDPVLFARARAKTPTERLRWLSEMQAFAEAAKKSGQRK